MARKVDLRRWVWAASAILLCSPFLLLAIAYHSLPAEIHVLRIPIGRAVLSAPKSPFTVFRVPLMNLTHGLMAALMLWHADDFKEERRRASYSGIFLTLLLTVALKSQLESLELGAGMARGIAEIAPWVSRGTVLTVIGGVVLAAVYARGVPLPWPELRLGKRHKIILGGLFAAYLAIVAASLLVSHLG